jgi:hypothetical protein
MAEIYHCWISAVSLSLRFRVGNAHPPKKKFCSVGINYGNNLPGKTNREQQPIKGGDQ